MKSPDATDPSARESETTGLPWPRTWPGVYLVVLASFALWIMLLVALTDIFA
jgi:hypothetical protein